MRIEWKTSTKNENIYINKWNQYKHVKITRTSTPQLRHVNDTIQSEDCWQHYTKALAQKSELIKRILIRLIIRYEYYLQCSICITDERISSGEADERISAAFASQMNVLVQEKQMNVLVQHLHHR
jgi:hypothetical protein